MADHSKPTTTSNYLDFVSEMHGRMDDLAVGFDPERTSATNVPNYSIRWSSVAKKWQYLDGSSWKDLANEYAINISGSAAKLKNARTISITGGGTAQPVQFDGSANIQLTLESLDLDNLTGLGSAAARDVGESSGNVMEVGAFGVGVVGSATAELKNLGDTYTGFISYPSTSDYGGRSISATYGVRVSSAGSAFSEIVVTRSSNDHSVFFRTAGSSVEYPAQEFIHTGNILTSTGNSTEYPMSQKAVTDELNTKNTQGTGSSQTRTNSQNDSRFIQGGSVVQGTGSSTTDVMSQKAVSDQLLGVGQTWQDMTSNRSLDTTYTNTTGRPISVGIYVGVGSNGDGSGRVGEFLIDGISRGSGGTSEGGFIFYESHIIPPGSTYRKTGRFDTWLELR